MIKAVNLGSDQTYGLKLQMIQQMQTVPPEGGGFKSFNK